MTDYKPTPREKAYYDHPTLSGIVSYSVFEEICDLEEKRWRPLVEGYKQNCACTGDHLASCPPCTLCREAHLELNNIPRRNTR